MTFMTEDEYIEMLNTPDLGKETRKRASESLKKVTENGEVFKLKTKVEDIINLLEQEIKWCSEHQNEADKNEAEWFIKGLDHAKNIIKGYINLIKNNQI